MLNGVSLSNRRGNVAQIRSAVLAGATLKAVGLQNSQQEILTDQHDIDVLVSAHITFNDVGRPRRPTLERQMNWKLVLGSGHIKSSLSRRLIRKMMIVLVGTKQVNCSCTCANEESSSYASKKESRVRVRVVSLETGPQKKTASQPRLAPFSFKRQFSLQLNQTDVFKENHHGPAESQPVVRLSPAQCQKH